MNRSSEGEDGRGKHSRENSLYTDPMRDDPEKAVLL